MRFANLGSTLRGGGNLSAEAYREKLRSQCTMRKIGIWPSRRSDARAICMFTLTATNDVGELADILARLDEHGRQQQWPSALSGRVSLVVEELFVNFATHAHVPEGVEPRFELTVAPHGRGVECTVVENSVPYDPRQASAAVDAALDDRPVGGLGLTIMMQMVSGIDYETADGVNTTRIRLDGDAL
jgi:serine/threonine-protein kinase RsbW